MSATFLILHLWCSFGNLCGFLADDLIWLKRLLVFKLVRLVLFDFVVLVVVLAMHLEKGHVVLWAI